jgi:hypothetical protein
METNKLSDSSSIADNLPKLRHSILQGAWLGILAAAMGSVLFLVIDLAFASLLNPWFSIGTVDASKLFWFVALCLPGFLIAAVPGAIGGGIIGFILRTLAHRDKLSIGVGIAVGISVAACSGYIAIQIARLLEPEMVQQVPVETLIAAILSAILAGLWHSWILTRWLRRGQT